MVMSEGMVDYHVHTYLCGHAEGAPEDYLRRAAEVGLRELGFSDHCPWPEGYDTGSRMDTTMYPQYRSLVEGLRPQAAELGLALRYGLEVDWVPGRMAEVGKALADEEFDYIIGSVHFVGEFPFDNPAVLREWDSPETAARVWNEYPVLLADMVEGMDFDIIGHLDLPKKFGHRPPDPAAYLAAMRRPLELAVAKGVAIEINTGGKRKPVGEFYPSAELLRLAAEIGVEITFGSDAHAPADVGADLAAALHAAREAGFRHFVAFERRRAVRLPLPGGI